MTPCYVTPSFYIGKLPLSCYSILSFTVSLSPYLLNQHYLVWLPKF